MTDFYQIKSHLESKGIKVLSIHPRYRGEYLCEFKLNHGFELLIKSPDTMFLPYSYDVLKITGILHSHLCEVSLDKAIASLKKMYVKNVDQESDDITLGRADTKLMEKQVNEISDQLTKLSLSVVKQSAHEDLSDPNAPSVGRIVIKAPKDITYIIELTSNDPRLKLVTISNDKDPIEEVLSLNKIINKLTKKPKSLWNLFG